jgi:hypothetical protein
MEEQFIHVPVRAEMPPAAVARIGQSFERRRVSPSIV